MDYDTKIKLNQIATRRGLTLSESIRELINREVGTDPLTSQLDELRGILAPLSCIDFSQLIYHIARASIAPVATVQMQDKENGDRLNDQVKAAAEKLTAKIMENSSVH
jgi:transposase